MKTITWTYSCDICKKKILTSIEEEPRANDLKAIPTTQISVIFTTEQTEGRSTRPYPTVKALHLCQGCMNRVLNGEIPFAQGAQGYNTYYFKQRKAQSAKKEQTL